MGVGVYSDNFEETGGTFLVDDILDYTQGYEDYLSQLTESEEPVSLDTYTEDELQQQWKDLEGIIQHVFGLLGAKNNDAFTRYETLKDNYRVHAREWGFEAGTTSAGTSQIVGVWQINQDWFGSTWDSYKFEIASEQMIEPQRFLMARSRMSQTLQDLIRLHIMEMGRTCSYKTSGWTTAQYKAPESYEAEYARLIAQFKQDLEFTTRHPARALREEGLENYKAVLRTLCSQENAHSNEPVKARVGVLGKGQDGIYWAEPDKDLLIGHITNQGGLFAADLGLATDFDEEMRVLPATDAVLQACLEKTAEQMEISSELHFDIPLATWFEINGFSRVLNPIVDRTVSDEGYAFGL